MQGTSGKLCKRFSATSLRARLEADLERGALSGHVPGPAAPAGIRGGRGSAHGRVLPAGGTPGEEKQLRLGLGHEVGGPGRNTEKDRRWGFGRHGSGRE